MNLSSKSDRLAYASSGCPAEWSGPESVRCRTLLSLSRWKDRLVEKRGCKLVQLSERYIRYTQSKTLSGSHMWITKLWVRCTVAAHRSTYSVLNGCFGSIDRRGLLSSRITNEIWSNFGWCSTVVYAITIRLVININCICHWKITSFVRLERTQTHAQKCRLLIGTKAFVQL